MSHQSKALIDAVHDEGLCDGGLCDHYDPWPQLSRKGHEAAERIFGRLAAAPGSAFDDEHIEGTWF